MTLTDASVMSHGRLELDLLRLLRRRGPMELSVLAYAVADSERHVEGAVDALLESGLVRFAGIELVLVPAAVVAWREAREQSMLGNTPPSIPTAETASTSVSPMANRQRRARGTAKGAPVIYAPVTQDAKDILDHASDVLGISGARALEALLLSVPLDKDGVPVAIDRSRYAVQEELPIPAA